MTAEELARSKERRLSTTRLQRHPTTATTAPVMRTSIRQTTIQVVDHILIAEPWGWFRQSINGGGTGSSYETFSLDIDGSEYKVQPDPWGGGDRRSPSAAAPS